MALTLESDVALYLEQSGRAYIKGVRIANGSIFIKVDAQKVAAVAHEGRHTSKRQLRILAKHLKEKFDLDVQVVLFSDEESARIANLLRDVLERKFSDSIGDVTVSLINAESASVWIDAESVSDPKVVASIEDVARTVLSSLALPVSEIHVQSPVIEEPTNVAILLALKLHARVNLSDLGTYLRRDFYLPSDNWLSSKLDFLRKKGLMVRDHDGYFYLTENGLSVVPISRRRNSSDISRALLLAKRKWT